MAGQQIDELGNKYTTKIVKKVRNDNKQVIIKKQQTP